MTTPLYRCPITGRLMQGWFADDAADDTDMYLPSRCLACVGIHYVNPSNGRALDYGPVRTCTLKDKTGSRIKG
jgi:hypothetical protein